MMKMLEELKKNGVKVFLTEEGLKMLIKEKEGEENGKIKVASKAV